MADAVHYLSLSLTNVRAFGGRQTLDLSKDGRPSRWCVIIGENGVGKTTLMQALAVMRPVPAFSRTEATQATGKEASVPEWAEPGLADYENDRILSLVRHGEDVSTAFEATLMSDRGEEFTIGYDVVARGGKLVSAEPRPAHHTLSDEGPLVIGYSAFRQPGHGNLARVEVLDPTESLFDEQIDLADPDEVAEKIDYAALTAGRDGKVDLAIWWAAVETKVTSIVASLIPNTTPEMVTLKGGIGIETPSGLVPLAKLSLGAQTMVAWVLDLAWRLCTKFPNSAAPFDESAIVLIDEVELHLHPIWQRSLRAQLLDHFRHIQFIVTTHAPVTAQESVAAGDPISVVRWEGDHTVILPDPFPAAPIRLDEVATGLFDLETSLPKRFEDLLAERRDLIRKSKLSSDEKFRLAGLNRVAHAVRSGSVNTADEVEQLMVAVPAAGQR